MLDHNFSNYMFNTVITGGKRGRPVFFPPLTHHNNRLQKVKDTINRLVQICYRKGVSAMKTHFINYSINNENLQNILPSCLQSKDIKIKVHKIIISPHSVWV